MNIDLITMKLSVVNHEDDFAKFGELAKYLIKKKQLKNSTNPMLVHLKL